MGLWKDPATCKWKYAFQHRGKMYGGGGYETKADARTAREDRRKLVASAAKTGQVETHPRTDMAFGHLADLYLDLSQRRHVKKTSKYKKLVYATFLRYCGDEAITVNKITPYLVQGYLQTRPSNVNYNSHRRELSAIFEYARKVLGVVPINPCTVIENLPVERAAKKIPTQEEFIKIINAAKGYERPIILVLAYTAARIDEVLRLKWDDVNFEHGFIRLWTRKTRDGTYRSREIPMRSYMKDLLLNLWEERTQDTWVFASHRTGDRYMRLHGMMGAICKRAGTPHYGFHSLRHFVSSVLLDREKVGTPTVSRLLGHQSLTTTNIYAHSIGVHQSDDGLGVAIDRLEASFTPKLLPATSSGLSEKQDSSV